MHLDRPLEHLLTFLPATVFAALVTGLICQFAMPIATRLGLLDCPSQKRHSNHLLPTPLLGGIAIVLPQILVNLAGDRLASLLFPSGSWQLYPSFALVLGVLLVVGAIDDRLGLSARLRLILKTAIFTLLMLAYPLVTLQHVSFPSLGVDIDLGYLALPATVLCAIALVNAINMADGRNGLVIGMCIIWVFALLYRAPDPAPYVLVMLLVSLFIALAYNLCGKLFLGDAGTYALGAFFALQAIGAHNAHPQGLTTSQVACLFIIPILDMVRLIIHRLKCRRSPLSADLEHLHHYLDRRLGWRVGLPVYLAMVAAPIVIALAAPRMGLVGLLAAMIIYFGVLEAVRTTPGEPDPSVPGE